MKNLIALIVLVLLCVGLAQTSPGHVLLGDVGLYEQPASYTELAFTAPADLPTSLPTPNSPINVSFDIRNVSGTARAYQWSVVLTRNGQSHVKATGAVTAPAQGRVTVTKSVAMTCVAGRLQVQVRLASPAQSTDFWVTCPPAKQGAK